MNSLNPASLFSAAAEDRMLHQTEGRNPAS